MKTNIEVKNLSIAFHHNVVFENANFTASEGELIGLIGPNGAGKSVFFKLLSGLMKPDQGSIKIRGEEIANQDVFPKNMGILIEETPFLPKLSGYANLDLLASIRHQIGAKEINAVLDLVGLGEVKTERVKNYSLGMIKKLGIAQAIMEKQDILLLDEPMNALDEKSVAQMRSLFQHLCAQGATLILTSHNPEDIHALAHRVYEISDRQIIERPLNEEPQSLPLTGKP